MVTGAYRWGLIGMGPLVAGQGQTEARAADKHGGENADRDAVRERTRAAVGRHG